MGLGHVHLTVLGAERVGGFGEADGSDAASFEVTLASTVDPHQVRSSCWPPIRWDLEWGTRTERSLHAVSVQESAASAEIRLSRVHSMGTVSPIEDQRHALNGSTDCRHDRCLTAA